MRAIERAKCSIDITTYSLSDRVILGALKTAQNRGVKISLVTDKSAHKIASLPWEHLPCKGLMHEKIAIFDGEMTILGSANLTETSLISDNNRLIAIKSRSFASEVTAGTSPILQKVGSYELEMWRLPDPGALEALIHKLQTAKKSIEISMYTFTHPLLIEEVIAAKRRGITIVGHLDRNAYAAAKKFAEAKVPYTLGKPFPLEHNKFAVIDKKMFIIGSANWTKSAFNKNKDYYLFIKQNK